MPESSAYFLALFSAVLFSGSSVVFARFSSSHSSLWMNTVKNTTALLAFAFSALPGWALGFDSPGRLGGLSFACFFASGFLGLGIGDFFLFHGYRRLGSARTIMLFSLSPLFLTIEGWLFFGQQLSRGQGVAILLMVSCVWTISWEKFRAEGHWEWKGILCALLGVLLDNIGIVLSRKGFDHSPGLGTFTANAARGIGSVLPLWIWALLARERVWAGFRALPAGERARALAASFFGSYLSLSCWLLALKIGHIGALAGVGSFNPIAASLWEWLLLRRRPSRYLLLALGLFLLGFFLLLRSA